MATYTFTTTITQPTCRQDKQVSINADVRFFRKYSFLFTDARQVLLLDSIRIAMVKALVDCVHIGVKVGSHGAGIAIFLSFHIVLVCTFISVVVVRGKMFRCIGRQRSHLRTEHRCGLALHPRPWTSGFGLKIQN